jgi:hypothetical protein
MQYKGEQQCWILLLCRVDCYGLDVGYPTSHSAMEYPDEAESQVACYSYAEPGRFVSLHVFGYDKKLIPF